MSDEDKFVTHREMDIVQGNTTRRLDDLSENVKKVHDCLDGARKEIGELKQENTQQTADIKHLKENAERADESRKRMHDKLDKIVSPNVKSSAKPVVGRNVWDVILEFAKDPVKLIWVAMGLYAAKEMGVFGLIIQLMQIVIP